MMGLLIDWEDYELIQQGDFTDAELEAAIEDVREELNWHYPTEVVQLEDLYDLLVSMRDRSN